jgi:hypothetical protein
MATHTFTLTTAQEAALTARLGDFDAHVRGIIDNALEDHMKWRLGQLAAKASPLPVATREALMDEIEITIDQALE